MCGRCYPSQEVARPCGVCGKSNEGGAKICCNGPICQSCFVEETKRNDNTCSLCKKVFDSYVDIFKFTKPYRPYRPRHGKPINHTRHWSNYGVWTKKKSNDTGGYFRHLLKTDPMYVGHRTRAFSPRSVKVNIYYSK